MRAGTAIWIIGWLFTAGLVVPGELEKNPNYKMGWKEYRLLYFYG